MGPLCFFLCISIETLLLCSVGLWYERNHGDPYNVALPTWLYFHSSHIPVCPAALLPREPALPPHQPERGGQSQEWWVFNTQLNMLPRVSPVSLTNSFPQCWRSSVALKMWLQTCRRWGRRADRWWGRRRSLSLSSSAHRSTASPSSLPSCCSSRSSSPVSMLYVFFISLSSVYQMIHQYTCPSNSIACCIRNTSYNDDTFKFTNMPCKNLY